MPEQDLKERVIKLEKYTIKLEGRMNTHEGVCAERYKNIMEKLNNLSLTKLVVLMSIVLAVFATIMKLTGL